MRLVLFLCLSLTAVTDTASGVPISDYDIGIDAIVCYGEQGLTDKAEDLLIRMVKAYPEKGKITDVETLIDAVQCYLRKGAYERAETVLRTVPRRHPEEREEGLTTYETGIGIVREQIDSGDFMSAEWSVRRMIEVFPDNPELMGILARLLFWQQRYGESIAVFRQTIALVPDEDLERELGKVEVAGTIHDADRLIEKGENAQAEALLTELFRSGRERYDSGYRLGMLLIRKRDYARAVELFGMLRDLFPEDSGFVALYVEALILNGDVREARKTLAGLPEDIAGELLHDRDDLFYRVRRNYVKASGAVIGYTKGYDTEYDLALEVAQRIHEITFVLAALHVRRFGLDDSQISLDIYSKLGERTKRWGHLFFSVSPDADFLPRISFLGEIYQGYRDCEFSFGYRRMNFEDTSVDILIPGVILYLPEGFSLNERLYFVPKNSGLTLLSTLYYEPSHKFRGYYSLGIGQTSERMGTLQDLRKFSTVTNRAGLEYRFSPSVSVGLEAGYEHRKELYDAYGANLYSRYWW